MVRGTAALARIAAVFGFILIACAGARASETPGAGGGAGASSSSGVAVVDAGDAGRLAELIREQGYRAILETDTAGDPMISSRMAGVNTTLLFDRCTDHVCTVVMFTTRFIVRDPVDVEDINEWNRTKLLGKAHLDPDGSPVLEYGINLAHGVSEDNFRSTVDWWDLLLNEFKSYIGF